MSGYGFVGKFLAASLLTAGLFAASKPVHAATFTFTASLTGDQETTLPTGLGPSTATGFASGFLTGDFGQNNWVLVYSGTFSGLTSDVTVRHIHQAPFGVSGPVVHDLDFATVATSGIFSGDWRFDDASRPLTDALASELIAGNAYFNIHSAIYPSGEIRGQISVVPEPPVLPAALMLAAGGLLVGLKRSRTHAQA